MKNLKPGPWQAGHHGRQTDVPKMAVMYERTRFVVSLKIVIKAEGNYVSGCPIMQATRAPTPGSWPTATGHAKCRRSPSPGQPPSSLATLLTLLSNVASTVWLDIKQTKFRLLAASPVATNPSVRHRLSARSPLRWSLLLMEAPNSGHRRSLAIRDLLTSRNWQVLVEA